MMANLKEDEQGTPHVCNDAGRAGGNVLCYTVIQANRFQSCHLEIRTKKKNMSQSERGMRSAKLSKQRNVYVVREDGDSVQNAEKEGGGAKNKQKIGSFKDSG